MNPAKMSTPPGEPGPRFFDVLADARGEGFGIGERPYRPELPQEPDGDRVPVKRAMEVEKQGLHSQRMGPEGRIGPDAGQGGGGPASAHGLGDEYAFGQDLVRGLQVGRGEAKKPSTPPPRHDTASDLVGPAERPGGLLDPAPVSYTHLTL